MIYFKKKFQKIQRFIRRKFVNNLIENNVIRN